MTIRVTRAATTVVACALIMVFGLFPAGAQAGAADGRGAPPVVDTTLIGVAPGSLGSALGASPGVVGLDASYLPMVSFADAAALAGTRMGVAFDGTSYWSCSGGSTSGLRLAQYTAAGVLSATYAPGLDFRSVFADAAGNVYARQYSDWAIYRMISPGVFAPLVTLTGGYLDAQSSVVLNGNETEYLAMSAGTVSRWDRATGAYLGSVTLSGYGSVGVEGTYPADRGIAVIGDSWYTYASETLSEWSTAGTRLGVTTLTGAGGSFDSNFSVSAANSLVFVVTSGTGGTWNGYAVKLPFLTFRGLFEDIDGDTATPLFGTLVSPQDPALAVGQTVDFYVDLNGDGDFDDPGELVGSGITADDGMVAAIWAHPAHLTGTFAVQLVVRGDGLETHVVQTPVSNDDLGGVTGTGTVTLSRPSGTLVVLGSGGVYTPDLSSSETAGFSLWLAKTFGRRGGISTYRPNGALKGSLVWNYESRYSFRSTGLFRIVPTVIPGYTRAYLLEGSGALRQWDAGVGSWGAAITVQFTAYIGDGDPDGFGIQFEGVDIPGESDMRPLDGGWITLN